MDTMTTAQNDSVLMSEQDIADRVLVQEHLAHEHLAKQHDANNTSAIKARIVD